MYLEKVQKIYKAFEIVTRVLMILSFVGGGIAILFGIFSFSDSGEILFKIGDITFKSPFISTLSPELLKTEKVNLLAKGAAYLFSGTNFLLAMRYFALEQKEGNPFTANGADALKKLGIMTIVLSVVSICVQQVIYEAFRMRELMSASNSIEVGAGIIMIIFSVILRYGVELRTEKGELNSEKTELNTSNTEK